MAYRISQTEAQPAEENQAQKDAQLSAQTEREFGVAPGGGGLKLFVIENSPHTPSSGLRHISRGVRTVARTPQFACNSFTA